MPHYYFSLYDHVREPDDIGLDLPDDAAARSEAIRFAGELVRDDPAMLDNGCTLEVRVTDAQQRERLRIEMRAIEPEPGAPARDD